MRSQIFRLTALALIAALAGLQAHAADEQVMTSGQVKFVSGGVGEDSNARMQALSKEFNFRLLFAAKDGHYLADVAVTITDARGAKILETVAQGPWLLATLAPGKYVITATYAGTTVTRATTMPRSGRREVFFRWEEPQYSGAANDKSR